MLAETVLEELVASTRQLYSLPAVALDVLELTDRADIDVAALKASIERDPALTGKIIRVVNSSLFGLNTPVSDLGQAVARLGIKPLKLLVLGFALPDALFADIAASVLSRYWRQTLTRAIAARELAIRSNLISGEEAFLAGLLADLGLLALVQGIGEPYVRLVERAWSTNDELPPLERRALGFDHAQLTVRMLETSRIPHIIVDAIAAQEPFTSQELNPLDLTSGHDALTCILREAEWLTRSLQARDLGLSEVARPDQAPLLDRAGYESITHDLEVKVAQLAEMLDLPLPHLDESASMLAEAHRRLVHEATTAATDLARQHTAPPSVERATLKASTADEDVRSLSEAAKFLSSSKMAQVRAQKAKQVPPRPLSPKPLVRESATSLDKHLTAELREALHQAVAVCRQSRWSLSLLLLTLERRSAEGNLEPVVSAICDLCDARGRNLDHAGKAVLRLDRSRWAVLFPLCERHLVVELSYEWLQSLQSIVDRGQNELVVSMGTATLPMPSRNFVPERLYEAAERCRFASQTAGGGSIKSIEIF